MSELNLRETIEKTASEIKERESSDEKETLPIEEPETPDVEEEEQSEETELASEPKAEEKPLEKPVEKQVEAKSVEAKPSDPEDKTLVNPPNTWKAKPKSMWNQLPPEIKKEIQRREQEAWRGITDYKQKAEFGNRLESTISPYQPFLKAKNIAPERVVADALNLAYQLDTSQPEQKGLIFKALARQYGVNLQSLVEQANPETDKFTQVIAPLQQRLDAYEQERQNNLLAQQRERDAQLEKQASDFLTATDETGQLKYPYVNDVWDDFTTFLNSPRGYTLEQAYHLACQINPEISALVKPASSQSISAEAKARAEKAMRNNKIAPTKKPQVAGTEKAGSMQDTIRNTLKSIRAT